MAGVRTSTAPDVDGGGVPTNSKVSETLLRG